MNTRKASNAMLAVALLVGLSLLAYPMASDWWNSRRQSQAIAQYSQEVSATDEARIAAMLADAERYNQSLPADADRFAPSEDDTDAYDGLLALDDTGVMGYLEIPSIDARMPIYHGTSDTALQVGAGHIEGSSLPVGGKGTHCVLSGHRGLPSARLFTDIDKLGDGDVFMIHVLGETLTYEVDQILTVDPYDLSALGIDPDQDYVTLVTCTPYGINTQRLLVRGHRVPNRAVAGTDASAERDEAPAAVGAVVAAVVAASGCTVCVAARRRTETMQGAHRRDDK